MKLAGTVADCSKGVLAGPPTDVRKMTMSERFQFDIFLSHSAKDKEVVRPLAERLRKDGLRVWFDEWEIRPGDSISKKIEKGLESSRVLVLCMSANAFGSDWAQLEPCTFRFRDPLNKERRFLPLRLNDDSIHPSLEQSSFIDWQSADPETGYAILVKACRPPPKALDIGDEASLKPFTRSSVRVDSIETFLAYAFAHSGKSSATVEADGKVRLWDVETGRSNGVLASHSGPVTSVTWSFDDREIITGSNDGTLRLWDVAGLNFVRLFCGHTKAVLCVTSGVNRNRLISGSADQTVRVWDLDNGECLRICEGHHGDVTSVALNLSGLALTGSNDHTIRSWDVNSGACDRVFAGNGGVVLSVSWAEDGCRFLSGSSDGTVRLWNKSRSTPVHVFEGHLRSVVSVVWSSDQRYALSGSLDKTVRLWDVETGHCLLTLSGHVNPVKAVAWMHHSSLAFSGDFGGRIRVWDMVNFVPDTPTDQVQYTNAKVLVVGDTNAGKTALTYRLATGEWKPSEDSTVGAWSTQLPLRPANSDPGVDREIWLWDFGGQADQRLIHQLYMDRTALILILFNADEEDVLTGLRDWQSALRRCVNERIPHFLVAGRIDTGFKASRGKLQAFAKEQGLSYHETSAKSGDGCDELRAAMIESIPWAEMENRTSPRIFKLIKEEILKLRDEGQVLHTFKELRELLWRRLPDEPRFTDETMQTVIGLLDGPGVVKELDYGTYILLAPEWINAYAQAVIRTLRSAQNDLGVLPLRSIAEGKLIYQSIGRDGVAVEMKRLSPAEERVVLSEMEQQLEHRGLCLRQCDKLVFPRHCGRDRPAVLEHPSVFVSYAVKGFLDDIYATLVVKLADSESFQLKELWRDAADFVTLAGDHHMGLKLTRESGSDGVVSVYFGKGVTQEEQVIFANYIHAHLRPSCEQAHRLRHYVCPKCHAPKGNAEVLMKKLLREKQNADTECDDCGVRFPLWDALEKKFASESVRAQIEQLQADDLAKLDTRRRGKLLALEVGARITSADQKCFEIPATEDEGLDMELEFTSDDGKGTGHRLYLQLKSGNSHLTKRKTDGAEIFTIKKQRWVEYWLQQPHPVMLVIGTFSEVDERAIGKDKLEFADLRWMEITSVLKRESQNGSKPVKQIEFKGERLDLSSVRRWREKVMSTRQN